MELGVPEEQLTKSLRKCKRQLKSSGDSHKGGCPVIERIAQRGPMKIEVLFFEGCPNYLPVVSRLRTVLVAVFNNGVETQAVGYLGF